MTSADSPDSAGQAENARPLSRREAREAAAAAASDQAMPVDETTPVSHTAPVTDEQSIAEAAPVSDAGSDADSDAVSTSTASTRPSPATTEESLNDLFETATVHTKKRGGCLVPLIVVLAIFAGLAGGGYWAWNTYGDKIQSFFGGNEAEDYAADEATGEVMFRINDGDGGIDISNALHAEGVTKSPTVFYDWLRANPPTPTFYPGVYRLQEKMTAEAAAAVLSDVDNRIANTVLLREGETLATILPAISETLDIPLDDLKAAAADPQVYSIAAPTLEGWLFPATYEFDDGVSAQDVLQTMIDRTVSSLDEAGVPVDERQRILNVAAIIQRESGAGDMGKVSRVIYNRLGPDNEETHGLLQMDSTVAYGVGKLHDGVVATTDDDRANDNPYNTYLHAGLPAGPISNSGDEAIRAAMHPEEGPWFYFVTVNLDTGETIFSETYEQQLVAEEKWHDWCEQNPDSGCYAP